MVSGSHAVPNLFNKHTVRHKITSFLFCKVLLELNQTLLFITHSSRGTKDSKTGQKTQKL